MRDYQVKNIRALDRGLEVLGHLQKARTASLHDLHLATALPKATLTRILCTLEGRGLIWQRLADGTFFSASCSLRLNPVRRAVSRTSCSLAKSASSLAAARRGGGASGAVVGRRDDV